MVFLISVALVTQVLSGAPALPFASPIFLLAARCRSAALLALAAAATAGRKPGGRILRRGQ